jgi:hypothetical protein
MSRITEFQIREEEECMAVFYPDENQHMPEYSVEYKGYLIVDGVEFRLTDRQALHCAFLYWIRDSIPVEWNMYVDDITSYYEMQKEQARLASEKMTEEGFDDLPF